LEREAIYDEAAPTTHIDAVLLGPGWDETQPVINVDMPNNLAVMKLLSATFAKEDWEAGMEMTAPLAKVIKHTQCPAKRCGMACRSWNFSMNGKARQRVLSTVLLLTAGRRSRMP
jgi:hypothetical protein